MRTCGYKIAIKLGIDKELANKAAKYLTKPDKLISYCEDLNRSINPTIRYEVGDKFQATQKFDSFQIIKVTVKDPWIRVPQNYYMIAVVFKYLDQPGIHLYYMADIRAGVSEESIKKLREEYKLTASSDVGHGIYLTKDDRAGFHSEYVNGSCIAGIPALNAYLSTIKDPLTEADLIPGKKYLVKKECYTKFREFQGIWFKLPRYKKYFRVHPKGIHSKSNKSSWDSTEGMDTVLLSDESNRMFNEYIPIQFLSKDPSENYTFSSKIKDLQKKLIEKGKIFHWYRVVNGGGEGSWIDTTSCILGNSVYSGKEGIYLINDRTDYFLSIDQLESLILRNEWQSPYTTKDNDINSGWSFKESERDYSYNAER